MVQKEKGHAGMGMMVCSGLCGKEHSEMKTKRVILLCAMGAAIVALLAVFLPRPVSMLLSGPLDEVNHMGILYISEDADNRFQTVELTEEQVDTVRSALEGMTVWYSPDFSPFAGGIPLPAYDLMLYCDDAESRVQYGGLTFDQKGCLYQWPSGTRYRILSGGAEILEVLQNDISE